MSSPEPIRFTAEDAELLRRTGKLFLDAIEAQCAAIADAVAKVAAVVTAALLNDKELLNERHDPA